MAESSITLTLNYRVDRAGRRPRRDLSVSLRAIHKIEINEMTNFAFGAEIQVDPLDRWSIQFVPNAYLVRNDPRIAGGSAVIPSSYKISLGWIPPLLLQFIDRVRANPATSARATLTFSAAAFVNALSGSGRPMQFEEYLRMFQLEAPTPTRPRAGRPGLGVGTLQMDPSHAATAAAYAASRARPFFLPLTPTMYNRVVRQRSRR